MTAPPDSIQDYRDAVEGKNILVTGGTGTVGYELLKTLIALKPRVVRIFSRDEQKQFYLREEFRDRQDLRFLVGDVRDLPRLRRAMDEVEVVFHLAALKHVESCEYNPFEAIKTNINGTQNVVDAALEADVESVVFTSTDKAVNPSNAMGASKLMAEKLLVAGQFSKGPRRTRFSSVRFGNVLGSSGSVVPSFVHRIRSGQPIDITHPGMTRYVIGFADCIELLLRACRDARGGEIFVRKMPVVRITDLAAALIAEMAENFGVPAVPTRDVGPRAGEKLFEELVTEEESTRTIDVGDYLVVLPQIGTREHRFPDAKPIAPGAVSSRDGETISVEAIRALLNRHGTLRDPNLLAGIRVAAPPFGGAPGDGFMETVNAG
ncbi:MAG: polysaccharide biosynthesis protein [Deltaproteobacteria bacterium]|nr:polysaccharide biosynthesis protein [Deltaproteobacteria bacterium]